MRFERATLALKGGGKAETVSTTCGSGWVLRLIKTHPLPQVVLTPALKNFGTNCNLSVSNVSTVREATVFFK